MSRAALLAITLCASWLVAGGAQAAPLCSYFSPAAVNRAPNLQPADLGLWITTDKAYFIGTWFCDAKYYWQQNSAYGYRSEINLPDVPALLQSIKSMDLASFQGFVAAHVSADSDLELKPLADAQLAATRPPPILWWVRPQANVVTRPVFALNANGTRNTTAIKGERVATQAPCSCANKAIEEPISGSDAVNVYCEVGGQPNASASTPLPAGRVSWCVRQSG